MKPSLQLLVIGAALLVFSSARVALVWAQETAAPTVSPGPRTPEAISAGDIPRQAEETSARLRDIARVLEGRDQVQQIQQQLPAVSATVRSMREDPNAQPDAVLTLSQLDDFQRHWVQIRDQLAAWTDSLALRAQAVDDQLAQLRRLDETWAATDASAAAQGIPKVLRDSIRSTRSSVGQLNGELRAWRTTILNLQGSLAQLSSTVSEELVSLDAREQQMRKHLLVSESEPIWSSVATLSPGSVLRPFRDSIRKSWDDLVAFARSRRGPLFLHGLLFVALLVLALHVRKRSQGWALDEDAVEMIVLLRERPLSSAALISLLLSPFLHPGPPLAFMSLTLLLSAVPAVRLLRVGLLADLSVAAFGVLALLLVLAWAELLPPYSPQARMLFLAENAAIGVWLERLIRPSSLVRLRTTDRWRRLVALSARVGQLVVAAAFFANLVGNVSLSVLLTHGTLISLFGAVALQASSGIVDGAFIAFLNSRLGRSLRAVREHGPWLRQRVIVLTTILAVGGWLAMALFAFGIFSEALAGVTATLEANLAVGSLSLSLGDVLALGVTIWVSFALARLVSFFLETDVLPHLSLPRGVPAAITMGVKYTIGLIGFFTALSAAGVQLGQITVLVGAFGVGLSFGLQNIVNNFVSGMILIFERPIQVGDTVEVDQVRGEVRSIGIRSSTIRTGDGAEVIVPNGNLLSQRVVNWTFSDRQRRIDVDVGVAYGSEPQQIIDLLLAVARANPDVLEFPPPSALFLGFGDSSLNFSLRAWTLHIETFAQIRSDLGVAVYNALRVAGVEIPFPQRDLHVRSLAAPAPLEEASAADGRREPGTEEAPATATDNARRSDRPQ